MSRPASVIGEADGLIGAVNVVDTRANRIVRDVTVSTSNVEHGKQGAAAAAVHRQGIARLLHEIARLGAVLERNVNLQPKLPELLTRTHSKRWILRRL